jgi:hypothetical protein
MDVPERPFIPGFVGGNPSLQSTKGSSMALGTSARPRAAPGNALADRAFT